MAKTKITNTAQGIRVVNVKVADPQPGESEIQVLVLQPGQTVEDVELANPDGRFEKGLISSGDLLLGDIPKEPTGKAETSAKISELEKENEGLKKELAQTRKDLEAAASERDALRAAGGPTPTSGNRRS